ncbi:hypothetical protein TSOC_014479, partial [Tetrabaena socialis]
MSRVPPYTQFWLQPFSRYAVTSLGRLSQRHAPADASGPAPPSAATGEGSAVRCFERFVMCKITLKKPTAAYFEAGQFVAEHYMAKAAPLTTNFTARLAAAMPPGGEAPTAPSPSVLLVVFAVRSKSHKDLGRVLLNEDELLERCNAQHVRLPADPAVTPYRRIACLRHVFGVDNLYDMWLVRHADVLVGVHGSALTNAMFMTRGSAVIELRPFGFSGRESWPNIYMNVHGLTRRKPKPGMGLARRVVDVRRIVTGGSSRSMPELPAPDLVLHMAAQFQAGGEGVSRPATAPSSDERRSRLFAAASAPSLLPLESGFMAGGASLAGLSRLPYRNSASAGGAAPASAAGSPLSPLRGAAAAGPLSPL